MNGVVTCFAWWDVLSEKNIDDRYLLAEVTLQVRISERNKQILADQIFWAGTSSCIIFDWSCGHSWTWLCWSPSSSCRNCLEFSYSSHFLFCWSPSYLWALGDASLPLLHGTRIMLCCRAYFHLLLCCRSFVPARDMTEKMTVVPTQVPQDTGIELYNVINTIISTAQPVDDPSQSPPAVSMDKQEENHLGETT